MHAQTNRESEWEGQTERSGTSLPSVLPQAGVHQAKWEMRGSPCCDLDMILMTETWLTHGSTAFKHMDKKMLAVSHTHARTRARTHTGTHTHSQAHRHTCPSTQHTRLQMGGKKSMTIGSCHLQWKYFSSGLRECSSERWSKDAYRWNLQ